ncbi:PREDICTED: protein FAM24A-like isoform X4 [Chinchilla lanigera]|uniref:protein FAM24A-like isoform X4 n=1 Tax=Chinchilla lanigera TaxID=34839 RepID=UPI00038EE42D|nr:PREDICTED: protein FAM24A-like isoform X4 [Chinchilla lanigera]XP_005402005.1 PREDICTED: protein FAM24A-like isoform X4 [Chinchilla lanigera]XP_005402006.1 PREDICTED: protein FAM24A-like isoform X4 [Chinchilla lanigera]
MTVAFDLRTMMLMIICSGILVAMFVLTGVVICLYVKLSKALKAAKEHGVDVNLDKDKLMLAGTTAINSCPTLQFCDECKMYADYDTLPPCFCNVHEGL